MLSLTLGVLKFPKVMCHAEEETRKRKIFGNKRREKFLEDERSPEKKSNTQQRKVYKRLKVRGRIKRNNNEERGLQKKKKKKYSRKTREKVKSN